MPSPSTSSTAPVELAVTAAWLEEKAHLGRPVGAAIGFHSNADTYDASFADLLDGDERLMLGRWKDAGCDILKLACDSWTKKPEFVVASQPQFVAALAFLTGLDERQLVDRVVGDVEALEYTIGLTPVYHPRDLLTAWRGAQQLKLPAYYENVAIPIQRLYSLPVAEGQGWEVSYSELFLRVVAHYSGDPQLTQALLTDEYPPQSYLTRQLAAIYDDVTEEHGFACILLAALGGDFQFLQTEAPEYAALIEEMGDLDVLCRHLDKMIPSIRLMATELWQSNMTTPMGAYFETLYGRRLPYQMATYEPMPGQYLYHILAGTVEDIIYVLCVTLANQGASVVPPGFCSLDHSITVSGTTKERDLLQWVGGLKQLSTLAGPLAPIPLNAVVGRKS